MTELDVWSFDPLEETYALWPMHGVGLDLNTLGLEDMQVKHSMDDLIYKDMQWWNITRRLITIIWAYLLAHNSLKNKFRIGWNNNMLALKYD